MARRTAQPERYSLGYLNGFDDAAHSPEFSADSAAVSDWACTYAYDATGYDHSDPDSKPGVTVNDFDEVHSSYVAGYAAGLTRWAADRDEAYEWLQGQWKLHGVR